MTGEMGSEARVCWSGVGFGAEICHSMRGFVEIAKKKFSVLYVGLRRGPKKRLSDFRPGGPKRGVFWGLGCVTVCACAKLWAKWHMLGDKLGRLRWHLGFWFARLLVVFLVGSARAGFGHGPKKGHFGQF